jgi:hypothetical protein
LGHPRGSPTKTTFAPGLTVSTGAKMMRSFVFFIIACTPVTEALRSTAVAAAATFISVAVASGFVMACAWLLGGDD